MHILVINGPNMNLLGVRQPEIYGRTTYEELTAMIQDEAKRLGVKVSCFQSNHEGALIDVIQQAYYDKMDGIIINPAAYTHTSGTAGRGKGRGDSYGGGPRFRPRHSGGFPSCVLYPGGVRRDHTGPRFGWISGSPAPFGQQGKEGIKYSKAPSLTVNPARDFICCGCGAGSAKEGIICG